MRISRVKFAATAAALVLAASCIAPTVFAKGGGFTGGGRASSLSASRASFSSSASRSVSHESDSRTETTYSSPSPAPKPSGFSSTGATKTIPTTALGGAVYAAQAGHDTATGLNATPSPRSSGNSNTSGTDYSGTPAYRSSGSASPQPPSYSQPVYSAPVPPTVVVHQASNDGFLWGWILGHESAQRAPVVVQPSTVVVTPGLSQGYQAAPASVSPAYAASGNDSSNVLIGEAGRSTEVAQPTRPESHWFLTALKWIVGLVMLATLLVLVNRAWSARKARFTSHTNYRL